MLYNQDNCVRQNRKYIQTTIELDLCILLDYNNTFMYI